MPKALHDKLVRQALAKGGEYASRKKRKVVLTERGKAYVYGTLNKKES